VRIGDFIACVPPLGHGCDDPTTPQTGEMIGHVGSRQIQLAGELGGIAGSFQKADEDARTRGVRHGAAQPVYDICTSSNGQHTLTIQWKLTYRDIQITVAKEPISPCIDTIQEPQIPTAMSTPNTTSTPPPITLIARMCRRTTAIA